MSGKTAWLGFGVALGLGLAGCGGLDTEVPSGQPVPCNGSALNAALAAAKPGEVVNLGECTVRGTVTVPAGVTLRGAGVGLSTVQAPVGGPAVVLAPGADVATTLESLSVVSMSGTAGVLAQGEGSAAMRRIDVSALRGIGVGAEGLTALELSEVTLAGAVIDAASAGAWSEDTTPDQTSTHGLVVVDTRGAVLDQVTVRGFAGYGALLVRTGLERWTGGAASGNVGAGVMVVGGAAALEEVEICGTMRGGFTVPVYGGLFVSEEAVLLSAGIETEGAAVTVKSGRVCDNEGLGLLYADGRSMTVDGTILSGNLFAGLAAVDASNVQVLNAEISGTREATMPLGVEDAMINGGDGAQLVRATGTRFEGVTSTENARAGVFIDLGGLLPDQVEMTWTNVNVHGNVTYGAICQSTGGAEVPMVFQAGSAPFNGDPAWDHGIDRGDDVTLAVDQDFMSPLDAIGAISPCFFPAPVTVVQLGLAALLAR